MSSLTWQSPGLLELTAFVRPETREEWMTEVAERIFWGESHDEIADILFIRNYSGLAALGDEESQKRGLRGWLRAIQTADLDQCADARIFLWLKSDAYLTLLDRMNTQELAQRQFQDEVLECVCLVKLAFHGAAPNEEGLSGIDDEEWMWQPITRLLEEPLTKLKITRAIALAICAIGRPIEDALRVAALVNKGDLADFARIVLAMNCWELWKPDMSRLIQGKTSIPIDTDLGKHRPVSIYIPRGFKIEADDPAEGFGRRVLMTRLVGEMLFAEFGYTSYFASFSSQITKTVDISVEISNSEDSEVLDAAENFAVSNQSGQVARARRRYKRSIGKRVRSYQMPELSDIEEEDSENSSTETSTWTFFDPVDKASLKSIDIKSHPAEDSQAAKSLEVFDNLTKDIVDEQSHKRFNINDQEVPREATITKGNSSSVCEFPETVQGSISKGSVEYGAGDEPSATAALKAVQNRYGK